MDPIRILIVEDEPVIAADLADRLAEMGYHVAGQYGSGEAALHNLGQDAPDLVLMDIQLGGVLDGIETTRRIVEAQPVPVIFLTSNSDEATFTRAKSTHPAAFLSKPFRGKDLRHAIELALSRNAPPPPPDPDASGAVPENNAFFFQDRIFIKSKERLVRIFISDILWVEATDYYCTLVTAEKKFLLGQTLKQLSESLAQEPTLMRVHRSYLVNLSQIEEIEDLSLLIGKQRIPVSKAAKEEIINRFQRL
ncbi:MAG: response regulator [Thermoanaerobaculia bacterium]|nr:response regulator [Thermoanaerobaculia bacterium]